MSRWLFILFYSILDHNGGVGSYLKWLQGVSLRRGEKSVRHVVEIKRFSRVHVPKHLLYNFVVQVRDINPIILIVEDERLHEAPRILGEDAIAVKHILLTELH